jgi:hypothetical protein
MIREKRGEITAYALDHTNKHFKRWQDDVRNGVSFKDYAQGRIEIHVHYAVRRRNGDGGDYCAVFQRTTGKFNVDVGSIEIPAFQRDLAALGNPNKWHQKLMLVGYVARVDEQEGILIGPAP